MKDKASITSDASIPTDTGIGQSAGNPTASSKPNPGKGRARGSKGEMKLEEPKTIGSLLRQVYEGSFKRSKLKAKVWTLIALAGPPSGEELDELRSLAGKDHQLDRTKHLLVLISSIEEAFVSKVLLDFATSVIKSHSAFQTESCRVVLEGPEDSTVIPGALRALAALENSHQSKSGKVTSGKKAGSHGYRESSFQCLLLILALQGRVDLEETLYYLRSHIWGPSVSSYPKVVDEILVLINTRDPAAALLLRAKAEQELQALRKETEWALTGKESALAQVTQLRHDLASSQDRLAKATSDIEHLKQSLLQTQEARETDRIHLRDDLVQMKGRTLRRLREEKDLLEEGLHALRKEPPRVRVMQDHAERAIEGLQNEINRLTGED